MRRPRWLALCLALLVSAPAARAQRVHVLVVTGLAGEPRFRAPFHAAATMLADTARARWGVADSSLIVLTDDGAGASQARGRSTRDEIAQAFVRLSRQVAPGDVLLVFLNGHGSGEGLASRVGLPGPDASAADFASWLAGFSRQTVVFVNAASGSGDFVAALARPGRLVVTATRTAIERNETTLAGPFVRGLTGTEADGDKDGRVSVREAFDYARKEVERAYEADNRMLTEHATLSDSALARTISFGAPRGGTDPRVVALVAERQELEAQVAALRAKKASLEPAAYDRELERLLLLIAERSQAIRAAGARP
jgi:chorismate mutase